MKNFLDSKTPSIIHFIWLGGELPQAYLKTIIRVTLLAKQCNFTLNIWVDDNRNFEKALEKFYLCGHHIDLNVNSEQIGINILNINTLLEKMQNDPFYQKNKFYVEFCSFVNREMVGFKNLAAASDFLRYEILRQQGGIYCDTDTKFFIKENSRFEPIKLPLGIKISRLTKKGEAYNDIIATIPNHEAIEHAIRFSIISYRKFNRDEDEFLSSSFTEKKTLMDLKRYPLKVNGVHERPRTILTVNSTGPSAIFFGIDTFTKGLHQPTCKLLSNNRNLFSLEYSCTLSKIGNVSYQTQSDQTWISKKQENLKSFDDNSLPNTIFFSPLNLEKNKLLETKTQVPKL